jgi:hypothetical protein
LITKYEDLLFQNTDDKVVLGKTILASDLSTLTASGWLSLPIILQYAEILNNQDSETRVVVLNHYIGLEKNLVGKPKWLTQKQGKSMKYQTFIINVGGNTNQTFVAKPGKKGCHWTILYIDLKMNVWYNVIHLGGLLQVI